MRPYLEKEILLLESNLERLKSKESEIKLFTDCTRSEKLAMKIKLQSIYDEQCNQMSKKSLESTDH